MGIKTERTMKSSSAQLASRGFLADAEFNAFGSCTAAEVVGYLKSAVPSERTLGARLATRMQSKQILPDLCRALEKEKKLYTKLALCDALVALGPAALPLLIPRLGTLGKNQHREPNLVDLKKVSFPLPRDIVARVIIRIGEAALPALENVLRSGTYCQKLEAVDALGHIAYTSHNLRSEACLHALLRQEPSELLEWKVIRAFQSFTSQRVQHYLSTVAAGSENKVLVAEARRSLERISSRAERAILGKKNTDR